MHDDDFAFLADPENLANAFALRKFLGEFEDEAKRRFTETLKRTLQSRGRAIGNSWKAQVNLDPSESEAWFVPTAGNPVPPQILPVVGCDDGSDADKPICSPYWGVYIEGRLPADLVGEVQVVAARNMENPEKLGTTKYVAYEYLACHPDGNRLDALRQIVGSAGETLAVEMVDKAIVLARELEAGFAAKAAQG